MNKKVSANLKSLQILRCIASVSVVYGHLFINPNFGAFGVDIFFVLSGFVIALVVSNQQTPRVFAISRVARIVPLYWLLTTLLMIIIYLAPHVVHETVVNAATIKNYLKSLFFVPYHSSIGVKPLLTVGWTLNYEILFYFCVWISLIVAKRIVWLSVGAILAASYVVFYSSSGSSAVAQYLGSELLLEFMLGILAFKIYDNKLFAIPFKKPLFVMAILSYAFMATLESSHSSLNRFIGFGVPSFILLQATVGLEACIGQASNVFIKALIRMGDASYSTYLTHWFVIVFIKKIACLQFGLFSFYSPESIVLTVGVALIVGQITFKYIDKPLSDKCRAVLLNRLAVTC